MVKKLLITGISGFIGSHCAQYFSEQGYEIFGIDPMGDYPINFIRSEVDRDRLRLFQQKFDAILHFAGSGTVDIAQKFPEQEYQKNVISTKSILEYMAHCNPDAHLIYPSSAAVYGNLYDRPILETDEVGPISSYGHQKLEAEKMCQEYSEMYGLHIHIVRFFSIYGEGLKKQILWDFCSRLQQNLTAKELECFGTGQESRDFIHIRDVMQLLDILLNENNVPLIINGGTGRATYIYDVLTQICKETCTPIKLIFNHIPRKEHPKSIVADISRLQSLSFIPTIPFEEGIKKYVQWFWKKN